MSRRMIWSSAGRIVACVTIGASLGVWTSAAWAGDEGGGVTPDVAAKTQVQTSGFLFKEIPLDKNSARAGEGQTVTMGGHAIALKGQEIKVGDTLRAATLQDPSMQGVAIAGHSGRVRILSVVPALQTPTCEQQTHYLSEKSAGLSERVELVTISLDTPEVQKKFAKEAEIENVTFLSDASEAEFGRAHGLLIEKPRMLTRAVLVVGADNVVRYLQVVPEVSHMPDMESAFDFARTLAGEEPTG